MAEISSLLGLITDDNTRQALIAQMENMFDNAPDEERLIQEIGNPTKVAVALIRYADSGKITPAAAPVVAPEQAQPKRGQPVRQKVPLPAIVVLFLYWPHVCLLLYLFPYLFPYLPSYQFPYPQLCLHAWQCLRNS